MNEDAVMAQRRNEAERIQVRVAYGAGPVILETFPESDPVRVRFRERAHAKLVAQGNLAAEEMAALPVKEAVTVVLKQLRGESSRRAATGRAFSDSGTPGAD